jgi:hypothetical protein
MPQGATKRRTLEFLSSEVLSGPLSVLQLTKLLKP